MIEKYMIRALISDQQSNPDDKNLKLKRQRENWKLTRYRCGLWNGGIRRLKDNKRRTLSVDLWLSVLLLLLQNHLLLDLEFLTLKLGFLSHELLCFPFSSASLSVASILMLSVSLECNSTVETLPFIQSFQVSNVISFSKREVHIFM